MSLQVDYPGWAAFILTGPTDMYLVIDSYLSGNPQTEVPPSPMKPKDVHVDLAAVSHYAGDHPGQTLRVLVGFDTIELLGNHSTLCLAERAGYDGAQDPRMELITSGTTYVQDGFTTHTVDARHIAFEHFPDGSYMTGEPLCYITRIKDGPACFSDGDMSLTYDMKLWGELFRPDVAFLGIDGVSLQGKSLDGMDPLAAAIYAEMLNVETAIPVRYRIQEHLEQLQQCLAVCCPECRCLTMKVGEPATPQTLSTPPAAPPVPGRNEKKLWRRKA